MFAAPGTFPTVVPAILGFGLYGQRDGGTEGIRGRTYPPCCGEIVFGAIDILIDFLLLVVIRRVQDDERIDGGMRER